MAEDGVIFTTRAAERIGKAVQEVEAAGGQLTPRRRTPLGLPAIRYGKPVEAVEETAIATVTLDPCDVNGNDIAGVSNVAVRVAWDGSEVEMDLTTDEILVFVSFPVEATADETRGLLVGGPTSSPESAGVTVGYGVPKVTASASSPFITCTVTDSGGTPILDIEEEEQEIIVWKNARRKPLYFEFEEDDVLMYVRFPGPPAFGGFFSRTEAFGLSADALPVDGVMIKWAGEPDYPAPSSTDVTGDPTNEDHLHIRGNMYMRNIDGQEVMEGNWAEASAWVPWIVIDPALFVVDIHQLLDGNLHDDTSDVDPVKGDLVYSDVNGNWTRFGIQAENKVLTVGNADLPVWQMHKLLDAHLSDVTGADPLRGDVIYSDVNGNWTRKGIGAANTFFVSDGTDPDWVTCKLLDAKLTDAAGGDPATGAMIYSADGADWIVLGIGANGKYLKVVGGLPAWSDITHQLLDNDKHDDTVDHTPVKGDLVMASANGTWSVLPVDGVADNWVVAMDTGTGLPKYQDPHHTLLDGDAHADTVLQTPTKGSIIVANATPKWDEVTIGADKELVQAKADGTTGFGHLRFSP